VSDVKSRGSVDPSVKLGSYKLKIPIVGSPMRDVCNGEFGFKLIEQGCYGIIHRFCSIKEQVEEYLKNPQLAAAVGVINKDFFERFVALETVGCKVFCIDVANGATSLVEETVLKAFEHNDSALFIVGNVASKEAYVWLSKLPNVIGVRCGIAGGGACTTKNATGVYHPMASLIAECKSVKTHGMPLIIADGGIKEPADFCKAIALGADCVMLGAVLAAAADSPAELIKRDGRFYKVYHGSASFEIQKTRVDKPKYIEGKTTLLEFNNETVEQVVTRFDDGLRSSMSYFNASTIEEYQKNVTWGVISK